MKQAQETDLKKVKARLRSLATEKARDKRTMLAVLDGMPATG